MFDSDFNGTATNATNATNATKEFARNAMTQKMGKSSQNKSIAMDAKRWEQLSENLIKYLGIKSPN